MENSLEFFAWFLRGQKHGAPISPLERHQASYENPITVTYKPCIQICLDASALAMVEATSATRNSKSRLYN